MQNRLCQNRKKERSIILFLLPNRELIQRLPLYSSPSISFSPWATRRLLRWMLMTTVTNSYRQTRWRHPFHSLYSTMTNSSSCRSSTFTRNLTILRPQRKGKFKKKNGNWIINLANLIVVTGYWAPDRWVVRSGDVGDVRHQNTVRPMHLAKEFVLKHSTLRLTIFANCYPPYHPIRNSPRLRFFGSPYATSAT